MLESVPDKVLKLVRTIVDSNKGDRNSVTINNPEKVSIFLLHVEQLKRLIGDSGTDLYLRFFHEFVVPFNKSASLKTPSQSSEFLSAPMKESSTPSSNDIAPQKSALAFSGKHGGSQKTLLSSSQFGDTETKKLFSKDILSQLEANSHSSPWLLVNNRLPEGQRETDIFSDLIYIVQGIDGLYIKYDTASNKYCISQKCNIPRPVKQIILHVCELGYLFRQLSEISSSSESNPNIGMVKKAFNLAVRTHLNDFIRYLANLDPNLNSQDQEAHFGLPQLLVSTQIYQRKFIFLYNATKKCEGLSGGALLSSLYHFSQTGDSTLSKISFNLLFEAAKPINRMLTEWINEGNLSDPFNEFFIMVDSTARLDKFWTSKYSIRSKMIPSFISDDLVNKILRIGKSRNFIKQICQLDYKLENTYGMLNIEPKQGNILKDLVFESPVASSLPDIILQIESKINKDVLDLMFEKYSLMMHLDALFRYLLLAQGDFVRQLLELLEPFLSQSAESLRLNNMTSLLESAINSTNAQFDSKDVLQRLDCKLAQSSPGDLGWDVFTLYYHTRGPLQVIVDPRSLDKYLKIFRFLWFIKRTGHFMDVISKDLILRHKEFHSYPDISKLIRFINLIKYEIQHFINQLEYFLTFEVLECSKAQLIDSLKKASDLDDIIKANDHFIDSVISLCFLNEDSEVILFKLHQVFKKVLSFESIYGNAVGTISNEINRSQSSESIKSSKYETIISYTLNKMTSLSASFRQLMTEFLHSLMESSNSQHYYLAFRLDFNEFYLKSVPQSHLATSSGMASQSHSSFQHY